MLISYNEGETKPEFHPVGKGYEWGENVYKAIPDYFSERREQGYVSRDALDDVEGRFLRVFWKTDAPLWKKVAGNLESDILSLILNEDRDIVMEALTNLIVPTSYEGFTTAKEILETLPSGPVIFYNSKNDSDRPTAEHSALGGNIFKVDMEDRERELIVDGVKLAEKLGQGTHTSAQIYEMITTDENLLMWHSVDEVVENVRMITTPPRPMFNMPWSEKD